MKNAIIVHGWNTKEEFFDPNKPTASNDHWYPWLTKQLMVKGFKVDVPEMPQSSATSYKSWKKEFDRFDINKETVLVGHSCGAGFLIRWLSENSKKVGRVFLVAPWLGLDYGENEFDFSFFNFEIDKKLSIKTDSISLLYSDNDFNGIRLSVDKIKREIDGINLYEFSDSGHFTATDGFNKFPELLAEILK